MDDSELAELNYKVGVRKLKYTKRLIDQEEKNIADIRNLITYKVDAEVLESIQKKMVKASRQLHYMITRFDSIRGEVMIPKKRLY